MKPILKKITLFVFVVSISLLALELSLRIGGNLFFSRQEPVEEKKEGVYTILALGESTTAEVSSTWPEKLEYILSEEGEREFRVINKGVPGTNSAFIVSRLEEYLDEYQPDMVITMMGINDSVSFLRYSGGEKGKNSGFKETILNLRIAKLAKWIPLSLKEGTFRTFQLGMFNNKELTEPQEQKRGTEYLEEGIEYYNEGNHKLAEKKYKQSLSLDPRNSETYLMLGWLLYDQGRYSEAEDAISNSIRYQEEEGGNLGSENDDAYTALVSIYRSMGMEEKEIESSLSRVTDEERVLGMSISHSPRENTTYHYQKLYEILKSGEVKYVAMQYPTLPLENLKRILGEKEDVIFVSNEENFEEAIDAFGYDRVFVDRMTETFGHTTLLGDELIAKSAAQEILEYLEKK